EQSRSPGPPKGPGSAGDVAEDRPSRSWRPGAGWAARPPRSIRVGADDLAAFPAAEGAEGVQVDRLLEEVDRPVGEEEVAAAGMLALEVRIGVGAPMRPPVRGRPEPVENPPGEEVHRHG